VKRKSVPSIIVATVVVTCSVAVAAAFADTRSDVRIDADFILGLMRPDGAILADSSRTLVDPYVGNYAAWGLAQATAGGAGPRYLAAATGWLLWYQAHMDGNGIVHDETLVSGGALQASDDEDSVDATSGVFLMAVQAAYRATPVLERAALLRRLDHGITAAVGAIQSLRDSDGMTWAKPSWKVKYLMDNAEAYGGLLAATDLALALGDLPLAATARDGASRARAGLMTLWNPSTQAYDWALHADGYRQVANWDVLYPDSVEQAWTVAFGVSEGDRSRALMAHFRQAQPNWDQPRATATYWDGNSYLNHVDFWSIVGWAFAAVGDPSGAPTAAAHIRDGAAEIDREPPFTSGADGQLIVLESPAHPHLCLASLLGC
jgi:hypothetical protein